MADFTFNIAKGKVAYYAGLPAANDALIVLLLQLSNLEADSALETYDDLATLLANPSDEATFTNYARKTITSVTVTVDDTNNYVYLDFADQTWTAAGAGQRLGKLLVCYDGDTTGGTDANIIPISAHDFVVTTNGLDLQAVIASGGFIRVSD